MLQQTTADSPGAVNLHLLMAYVADLELEVDRLRKHGAFTHDEMRATLKRIQLLCTEAKHADDKMPALGGIEHAAQQSAVMLREMHEAPGYHPAHDQVTAIAVRPLAEQVFRWQKRLTAGLDVVLRLELESEHVEWFPARLRHVLDNLFSNALKYRDPAEGGAWVQLGLRVSPEHYEFCVSDNGIGMSPREQQQVSELFYRSAPTRAAGMGVGLAVVKLLVEQSGGALTVESSPGQGTKIVALLPRYDVDDFLT